MLVPKTDIPKHDQHVYVCTYVYMHCENRFLIQNLTPCTNALGNKLNAILQLLHCLHLCDNSDLHVHNGLFILQVMTAGAVYTNSSLFTFVIMKILGVCTTLCLPFH